MVRAVVEVIRCPDGRMFGTVQTGGHWLPTVFSNETELLSILQADTRPDRDRWLPGVERRGRVTAGVDATAAGLVDLAGMDHRLRVCAKVAQLACGDGDLVIRLAQAYPNSWFAGYDSDPHRVEQARRAARGAEVQESTRFEVATPEDFPGQDYDLLVAPAELIPEPDPIRTYRHYHAAIAANGVLVLASPDGRRDPHDGAAGRGGSATAMTVERLANDVGFTWCHRVGIRSGGTMWDIRP